MSERDMYEPEMILWHGKDRTLVAEKAWAWDNAQGALQRAEADSKKQPKMHGDADPLAARRQAVKDAEREYNEAVAGVQERATTVRVRALGRREWRDIVNDHPARPGNEADEAAGWNTDTLPEVAVRAALLEPEFSSTGQRDQWLEHKVTPGEFEQMYELVIGATLGEPKDPKDLASDPSSGSTGG